MWRKIGYEGDRWVAYFWFVGWDCISLGLHVCFGAPNIEIHLPFGFIRIGRKSKPVQPLWVGIDFSTFDDLGTTVDPVFAAHGGKEG